MFSVVRALVLIAGLIAALVACRNDAPREPSATTMPLPPPAPVVVDASPAWRSCLIDGSTPCLSNAPIKVGSELIAWSNWIGEREHVTECRWVAEIANVLLCASTDLDTMNPPLLRPAIFIENRPRSVVSHNDPLYVDLLTKIGGFDLLKRHPAGTHPDLVGWYAAVDRACATDKTVCEDPAERAMRALLERAWVNRDSFVVITFAAHGSISDDEVVSHEMLHAQYFTDPGFRGVVTSYWDALPKTSRDRIRAELGVIYSTTDEELIQNELQAYALMSGAETSRFSSLVAHREPLQKALAEKGIIPIAVERRR